MKSLVTLLLSAGTLSPALAQERTIDPAKRQTPQPALETPIGGFKDHQVSFGPDFVKSLPEKDRQRNDPKEVARPVPEQKMESKGK